MSNDVTEENDWAIVSSPALASIVTREPHTERAVAIPVRTLSWASGEHLDSLRTAPWETEQDLERSESGNIDQDGDGPGVAAGAVSTGDARLHPSIGQLA